MVIKNFTPNSPLGTTMVLKVIIAILKNQIIKSGVTSNYDFSIFLNNNLEKNPWAL
jgi:hypothetical protein